MLPTIRYRSQKAQKNLIQTSLKTLKTVKIKTKTKYIK